MSHTPGPWCLIKADENVQFDWVEPAPKRRILAEGRSEAEANANARLIAAAPEMLEMLKGIVQNGYDHPMRKEAVKNLINKAEGKA